MRTGGTSSWYPHAPLIPRSLSSVGGHSESFSRSRFLRICLGLPIVCIVKLRLEPACSRFVYVIGDLIKFFELRTAKLLNIRDVRFNEREREKL